VTPPPANGRPRRRPRAAGTAAVALCSVLLAGCGGSSPKGSGSGGPGGPPTSAAAAVALPADRPQRRACALVTQAEVEAALGAKVGAGRETSTEARSVCGFALSSAGDQSVIVVSTSSSGVPAYVAAARREVASPQPVPVGDEAFVFGAQGLVRKGDTMVSVVMAVRQEPAPRTAAATRLIQAAGARL
jgi:hypothetical protein